MEQESVGKKSLVAICSICQSARDYDGNWIGKEDAKYSEFVQDKLPSHTYCPPCYAELRRDWGLDNN